MVAQFKPCSARGRRGTGDEKTQDEERRQGIDEFEYRPSAGSELRTKKTRGAGARRRRTGDGPQAAGSTARTRRPAIDAPHLVALVHAGTSFVDGAQSFVVAP